jgi:predicted lipoprotein with Yx(FWY)xxD motif
VRRTYFAVGALALSALLVIAGCGGGGSSSSSESSEATAAATKPASNATPAPKPKPKGKVATVNVADTPDLGKVVVDSKGMTLYDFHKDKGTTSA